MKSIAGSEGGSACSAKREALITLAFLRPKYYFLRSGAFALADSVIRVAAWANGTDINWPKT